MQSSFPNTGTPGHAMQPLFWCSLAVNVEAYGGWLLKGNALPRIRFRFGNRIPTFQPDIIRSLSAPDLYQLMHKFYPSSCGNKKGCHNDTART